MSDNPLELGFGVSKRRDFLKNMAATAAASAFIPFDVVGTHSSAFASPVSDDHDVESCPYGVCAHIGGGEEFDQAPQNLE